MSSFRHESNVPVRPRAVQPESRLRVSGPVDAVTRALAHAAHLAASQKRALHATIHESTAPAKAIAESAGLSYSFLANAALTSTTDQLPFPRLPLVLEASDDLTLLRFLAQLQGCDVFRLPRAGASADARRAAVTMREVAEFLEAGAQASEDDVVTPDEFARVEREGLEAVRAILEHIAHYRVRVRRPLLEGM